ncbi:MAG: hypothetical protein QM751_08150 [Paludibacteraceae bacterium]
MEKIITFLLVVLFSIFTTKAQIPQGISYQAIAFNTQGTPVTNGNVGIKISILDTSINGSVIYSETHTKATNAQGLFNLNIGLGTPVTGVFSAINWGLNPKFLKVEIDPSGGTNYTLVGSNQLMSVPYALASKSLITSAGEGITMVSPNGTSYKLTVNDNGELSLPTSNNQSNAPTQLFLYGSFNSWNASTSLQFGNNDYDLIGFQYFTAGTQIKFLSAQNTNVVYGGNGNNSLGELVLNGTPITISSNGFYEILVRDNRYYIYSVNAMIYEKNKSTSTDIQYNVTNNYFYATSNDGKIRFNIIGDHFYDYGDNLADGTAEVGGADILSNQGKTYNYKFYLNFNGSANYTKTP